MVPQLALSKNEAPYTFKEPIVIGPNTGRRGLSLGQTIEESSRFNHYENQSLRAFSSVFVDGVDQRFLNLNFNGFSLRDPSTPTGVFNLSAVSALRSVRLNLEGGDMINIETDQLKEASLVTSVSSLGEAELSANYGSCEEASCTAFEAVALRGGGYSQLENGDENDYFEEITFSGARSYNFKGYKLTTRLLYYGQRLDLDSVGPLNNIAVESQRAEALNSVFLVGQDIAFSKKHRLKFSYLSSYRNQRDNGFGQSFQQRGEVLESAYLFKKKLKVKVFHEKYDLYSSQDEDIGFNVQKSFVLSDFVLDLEIGRTKLRSLNWSSELGYKNLVLFYKGQPASLFQQSYNKNFSVASPDLSAQTFLGARYEKKFIFSFFKLKLNASYSRIYEFIDFYLDGNFYANLGEVENSFTGVTFTRGPLSFYVQNQVARQVKVTKQDLARRTPWTLGLRYKKLFKNSFALSGGVKWLSKRKAFDQSDLKQTWISDLRLSYKNIRLTCTNVFSEKEAVFKNLGRKPLAFAFSYQKNF